MNESPLIHRNNFLLEELARLLSGGGGGAASNVSITGDTVGLNKELTQQQIQTILSNILTKLSDDTQVTQITDGNDTLAIRTNGSIDIYNNLPFGADYLLQSNPNVNGKYQTITYRSGGAAGTIVRTLTLTYDANDSVISYTEA